jgi:hypothetical protein
MSLIALGIEPGAPHERNRAAWAAMKLEPPGTIGLFAEAQCFPKPWLRKLLERDALFADERLRVVALAAPLTPAPLRRRPLVARQAEISFSRGAFSATKRGLQPAWLSNVNTGWRRYQEGMELLDLVRQRGFPLLEMPPEGVAPQLPARFCAEVFPKATISLLLPRELVLERPRANQFLGQLDDWLFPRAFLPVTEAAAPQVLLEEMLPDFFPWIRLSPQVLAEARRISNLRRPSSRREPLRAFLGALQGALALADAGCLLGAAGEEQGSYLLPRVWHPDWERAWRASLRVTSPNIRRINV